MMNCIHHPRPSTTPRRTIAPAVMAALVLLVALTGTVHGQTDHSLRMRVLGTAMSGVLDDAISDAFRNPARVGGIAGTQIYGVNLPSRWRGIKFPTITSDNYYAWSTFHPVPLESFSPQYMPSIWYEPLAITVFTPLRGSWAATASVEVAADGYTRSGSEELVKTNGFPEFDEVRDEIGGSTRVNDLYHAVFDVAFASARPDQSSRSLGCRLRARYDYVEDGEGQTNTRIAAEAENLTELSMELDNRVLAWDQHDLDIRLDFGLFRPGSTVREVTAGLGIEKQSKNDFARRVVILDRDHDGNGQYPGGIQTLYSYQKYRFATCRDYVALQASGEVVLELGHKVRTKHAVFWSEGSGDGDAEFLIDDEYYGSMHRDIFNEIVRYLYDGDTRMYGLTSTIGVTEEVRDGVTVAVGAAYDYARQKFDEKSSGAGNIRHERLDTTLVFDSPFRQSLLFEETVHRVTVPASVEWEIKPYFTCRVGLFFSALRSETKTTGLQSGELLFGTTEFRDLAGDAHHVIDYSTDVSSVLGFEINLRNRLFLDFYDSSTSSFGFEYVSLRYRF